MAHGTEEQIINELYTLREEIKKIQNDIEQIKETQYSNEQPEASWGFLEMFQSFLLGFFGVVILLVLFGIGTIILSWIGIW